MSVFRANIISNLSDWEQIRAPWNELLEKSASNTVFLTWEWLYSWAECFLNNQRELFIVVVYEDETIVGIAPWYVGKVTKGIFSVRQIEFIGTPEAGSDYLDVVITKGKEKVVTQFIYDFIVTGVANMWDRFLFNDIPFNSLFLLHLLNIIREKGAHVSLNEASFCPIAVLASTEDEYFAGLSSKRRQRHNQDLRTLNKQDAVNHVTFSSGNLDEPIRDYFKLYAEKTGRPSDHLQRFVRKYADKKGSEGIQIDFLSAGGSYVGGLLHLRHRDTLYLYLMAIDKAYNPKVSIGNLLAGLCIINAIQSGLSCYDFLKGDENYKFNWANHGRRAGSVQFTQRKLMPVCVTLAEIGKSVGKLILR